jgi:SsrA-binding protein
MKEVNIKNKKSRFEYEISDEFTAGIQLTGTEIKSIRSSNASIKEAFCYYKDGEVFIRNMHIAPYENGSYANHEPRRERKLLLTKKELKKIGNSMKVKGVALVPIKLFILRNSYAKLQIGLGTGKKLHDKRESLKQKDAKRDLDRMKKRF